ncbi:MAG: hypothetical protein ACOX9E_13010 [Lentisphaeria bacterium]|jgi:hypothetical protein
MIIGGWWRCPPSPFLPVAGVEWGWHRVIFWQAGTIMPKCEMTILIVEQFWLAWGWWRTGEQPLFFPQSRRLRLHGARRVLSLFSAYRFGKLF